MKNLLDYIDTPNKRTKDPIILRILKAFSGNLSNTEVVIDGSILIL